MPTNYDMDSRIALGVTNIMGTTLSSYSRYGHALLANIDIIPQPFGKMHITRNIADPYNDVMLDRRFNAPEQMMEKRVQDIDMVTISKRLMIDAVDYASDPQNVARQVADSISIIQDGIEKYIVEGSSTRLVMYGLYDYPNATAGTINRPEMGYVNTTAGDWSTLTNMQTDISASISGLIANRFFGRHALLAPPLLKPLVANVMTNTAIPVSTWLASALGLPVIFSPFVHEAATKDDFNIMIIDLSKVHLAMSDLRIDEYYSNKDHAYFWDFEVHIALLPDPLYDGTEWLKGVAMLDARDWSD